MIGKSSQIDQLSALLNQSQAKHEIISSNLANVNTPNFQTKDIRFDDVLSQISGIATPGKDGKIYNVEGLVARQDGNNVDVDRELSNMTKKRVGVSNLHANHRQQIGNLSGSHYWPILSRFFTRQVPEIFGNSIWANF